VPPSEAELIERARRGDHAAYAELVRRHESVLFRAAYLVCGSAADAEDAAQEALVRAYGALGRFRPGEPFRPWLLAIVANEARNRRRSAGRRAALALRAQDAVLTSTRSALDEGSPEGAALAGDERATLLAAVESLREEDRLVIACRYLLDLGEAETAAVLGLPRGTVKSRLSRALGRLRERLEVAPACPPTSSIACVSSPA
jgi:RNA polymerase sigma factor (sigma-70 family)